jgi:hypothetical protein
MLSYSRSDSDGNGWGVNLQQTGFVPGSVLGLVSFVQNGRISDFIWGSFVGCPRIMNLYNEFKIFRGLSDMASL